LNSLTDFAHGAWQWNRIGTQFATRHLLKIFKKANGMGRRALATSEQSSRTEALFNGWEKSLIPFRNSADRKPVRGSPPQFRRTLSMNRNRVSGDIP
jgi:hypothetical protein